MSLLIAKRSSVSFNKQLSNIKEKDEDCCDIHNLVDDFLESDDKPIIKLNQIDDE